MTPEEFALLGLKQGDVVKLHWLDIYEDSVGDTSKAELGLRHTYTLFWEAKESKGIACIVTCNTVDSNTSQQGWCCTPLVLIPRIEIIKRVKGKRKKNVPAV
jgi:hypothetical protein